MTNKQLLELAAKASGIEGEYMDHMHVPMDDFGIVPTGSDWNTDPLWNPLKDDGDAFRLAVKLSLSIEFDDDSVGLCVRCWGDYDAYVGYICSEYFDKDGKKATRLAITRAAAAIGAAMGETNEH